MPAGVLLFVLLFFRRVFGGKNNKIEAILVILRLYFSKNNKVGVSAGSRVHFFSIQGQKLHKKADLCNFRAVFAKNVHVASLKNGMCIIVTHFYRQQLYINAGLCNC